MSNKIEIVERKYIDSKKWEQLVLSSKATVYNQVEYLDALSENWCALIIDDYSGALAIPYTIRLGVKGIITPNFIRSLDWMGEKPANFSDIELLLKKQFRRANFHTNTALFKNSEERVFQFIKKDTTLNWGSQTKRGIKKFEKTGLTIENIPIETVLPLVIDELRSKVKDLNTTDFQRFENLLLNYPCFCVGIQSTNGIHAGIILIEWNNEILYIKGGVDEFGKKHGLMHALMAHQLSKTLEEGKDFNFEGSSVESVRQFNLGFGASENVYFSWKWDNSPWWFRLLLKLKK